MAARSLLHGACLAALALADGSGPSVDLAAAEVLPSRGCSTLRHGRQQGQDSLMRHKLKVADFEEVERVYWVQTPPAVSGAAAGGPAPLLLAFHGQTQIAKDFAQSHNFSTIGARHGLISVFPQGMGDADKADDQGTGWNVGSAGMAGNATCIPQGVGDQGGCYKSCRKLGRCGRCNWSTCYDDILFVKKMLAEVEHNFCIDLNRIYLQGESNGGMMVTHVVRELPNRFAGVASWYGTPMLGYLLGKETQLVFQQAAVAKTALITLHARSDVTIPPGGGVSEDGWIFEPERAVRGLWAAIHGCEQEHSRIHTKWDGGSLNFACHEHIKCSTGRRVVGCRFDGAHGDWPESDHGDRISLWFLFQFSRGMPSSAQSGAQVVI